MIYAINAYPKLDHYLLQIIKSSLQFLNWYIALSDPSSGVIPLPFHDRLNIAVGISKGLSYLHSYAQEPIIHRDVKPENILLTGSLEVSKCR